MMANEFGLRRINYSRAEQRIQRRKRGARLGSSVTSIPLFSPIPKGASKQKKQKLASVTEEKPSLHNWEAKRRKQLLPSLLLTSLSTLNGTSGRYFSPRNRCGRWRSVHATLEAMCWAFGGCSS
ncbi:hypothetical protein VNO78_18618 [Psophocarpus tetragonolobus]|uniref:Uncharacterized protein n=1 Tax=Psophocarpus tetragonolobus TaxID=3891 RepID=A0AAN9SK69_PSOTE